MAIGILLLVMVVIIHFIYLCYFIKNSKELRFSKWGKLRNCSKEKKVLYIGNSIYKQSQNVCCCIQTLPFQPEQI